MDKHILERMTGIINNLQNANLNDVSELLDYYNGNTVMINGTAYHPFNDPITAARLNAKYHELTGQDHPRFIEQTPIIVDGLIKDKDKLLEAGAYTPMYFDRIAQIKGSLTGENSRLEIVEGKHPLQNLSDILNNLDSASLEEVSTQLDYYNGNTVMINGTVYHPFNDPITAARLNAKYRELTGQNHPRFIEQTPIIIDGLMKDKDKLLEVGAYTPMYFDRIAQIKGSLTGENSRLEIAEGKHPLQNLNDILNHLDSASLEEVSTQLDYYNGNTVMINGTAYHPFNDPITAARLNTKYRELTGQNHPRFIEQTPIIIDGLMKDKDKLLEVHAYPQTYFDTLAQVKNNVNNTPLSAEDSKAKFFEERDKQRELDNAVRTQQFETMNNAIHQNNEEKQMIDNLISDKSAGGINRK